MTISRQRRQLPPAHDMHTRMPTQCSARPANRPACQLRQPGSRLAPPSAQPVGASYHFDAGLVALDLGGHLLPESLGGWVCYSCKWRKADEMKMRCRRDEDEVQTEIQLQLQTHRIDGSILRAQHPVLSKGVRPRRTELLPVLLLADQRTWLGQQGKTGGGCSWCPSLLSGRRLLN